MLTQRIQTRSHPVRIRRDLRHRHLLKIRRSSRAPPPHTSSISHIAARPNRLAQPIQRLALDSPASGTTHPANAADQRRPQQLPRPLRLAIRERSLRQQNARPHKLREHQSFPTLPRLKLPPQQKIHRPLRLPVWLNNVANSTERSPSRCAGQFRIAQQLREPHRRRNPGPFPKLIALGTAPAHSPDPPQRRARTRPTPPQNRPAR